jgi:hypothetical protein
VLHWGKRFSKKRRTAPTALNLPRVLGWHSGKASPSVRFLALGEDLFPVKGIPRGSSPSVALEEGFPECFFAFPECIWHSGKHVSPVVRAHVVALPAGHHHGWQCRQRAGARRSACHMAKTTMRNQRRGLSKRFCKVEGLDTWFHSLGGYICSPGVIV